MKTRLLTFAASLALVAVLGHFYAKPLLAQVRAALVSNVDDPGRIPYSYAITCSFTGARCISELPKVPAGKRLVIENFSGLVYESLPGGTLLIPSLNSGPKSVFLPATYAGSQNGHNVFVFSQRMLGFYDPGEFPFAQIQLGNNDFDVSSYAQYLVTGYMLDCSTGPCAAIVP